MRACWLLPVFSGVGLLGCSFDGMAEIDDEGRERVTWTLDTADDFRRPGAMLDGAGIEAWGSVSSGAYAYGMTHVRAVNSALWRGDQADGELRWDAIDTAVVVGSGLARAYELAEFGGLAALYINGDRSSLAFTGEIYFANTAPHTLLAQCDDVCFVELAAPNAADFTRVVTGRGAGGTTGVYTPASGGWHRFRFAYANTGGGAVVRLTDTTEPLGRARVRVRADGLRGLQRQFFDQQLLTSLRSHVALETSPLLARLDFEQMADRAHVPPLGGAPSQFSLRWAGQIYIAVAGAYAVRVRSDNGNRVQLGAMRGEGHWAINDPDPNVETTVTTDLEVGWAPLVIDYNQGTGGASVAIELVASPDPEMPAGTPVPVDRLRPLEAASRLVLAPADRTRRDVVDNNPAGATSALAVTAVPGEVPRSGELQVHVTSPRVADLAFDLVRPGGSMMPLTPTGAVDGMNKLAFQLTAAQLGGLVEGTWGVRVRDTAAGGGDSDLEATYLTLHTTGGPPLVIPDTGWTSEIIDLGERPLVDVPSATWTGRGAVEVDLRACAIADCTGEDWVEAESGKPVTLPANRRYLQARIRLHSAGTNEAALDSLTIVYRLPAT